MSGVEINQISKTYGKGPQSIKALDQVTLTISQGSLFGLIGPDGAGKTTLFRILTTLMLADQGEARVGGLDVVKDFRAIRKRIGYMPGRFSLYQDLTVKENLDFFATIFNTSLQENYALVKEIYGQIEPFRNRRAGKLSGGMKQKLALCCALIHRPDILFLDEPTTGVDAISRKEFWEMLQSLRQQGITILVSTPYMDEAGLCEQVALIQNGKVMTVATPDGIVNAFRHPLFAIKATAMNRLLNELEQQEWVEKVYPSGIYHHLILKDPVNLAILDTWLMDNGFSDASWKQVAANIEDCFIDLMS